MPIPSQLLRLGLPGTAAVHATARARFALSAAATGVELRLGYQEGLAGDSPPAAEPRLDEAHQLAPATGGSSLICAARPTLHPPPVALPQGS